MDVVAAVIKNDLDEFLLAQKSEFSSQPLHWEFPGGKIESGESEAQAIIREIKEELGIEVVAVKRLGEVVGDINGQTIRLIPVFCRSLPNQKIQLTEHKAFQWMELSRMHQLKAGPLDREVMELLRSEAI